jgi:hypothetical protein
MVGIPVDIESDALVGSGASGDGCADGSIGGNVEESLVVGAEGIVEDVAPSDVVASSEGGMCRAKDSLPEVSYLS